MWFNKVNIILMIALLVALTCIVISTSYVQKQNDYCDTASIVELDVYEINHMSAQTLESIMLNNDVYSTQCIRGHSEPDYADD